MKGNWCWTPLTDNPLSYYPKASCREKVPMWVRIPTWQRSTSAAPAQPLLFLFSCGFCGFGIQMKRRGLALELFGSVAAGLSFGEPMCPSVGPTLSWDDCGTKCLDLLATQKRLRTHGSQQKSCIAFYHWGHFSTQSAALDLLCLRVWKVRLFHCTGFLWAPPSPASDSDTEVTMFKDGLGSEFKDLSPLSYLLSARRPHLFFTSCLVRAAPCMGISSIRLCRSHRSDLLIGAIKL